MLFPLVMVGALVVAFAVQSALLPADSPTRQRDKHVLFLSYTKARGD